MDTIKQIQEAEANAAAAVQVAEEEAKKIVAKAEIEAEAMLQTTRTEAHQARQKSVANQKASLKQQYTQIITDGEEKTRQFEQSAKKQLPAAVKHIVRTLLDSKK